MTLHSLLAMVPAFVVVVLFNLGGGKLADTTGFQNGGEAGSARNLVWAFLVGLHAAWAVLKRAPRAHVVIFRVLTLTMSVLAAWQLGGDWLRWFGAGILPAAPLQMVLGMGWALRDRKRA